MIGLVIGVGLSTPICYAPEPPYNETDAKEFDPNDLPWDNETDIIIFPSPSLPPIFSDFNITPTEIQLGDDLIISFVIENTNNHSYTWMSTTRICDFFTQIIEIELEPYESKIIWYRIIPHITQGAPFDVWIDGQTGTFMVIPPDPWPVTDEVDPVIIVVDPLEELSLKIDSLQDNIGQSFNTIDDALVEVLDAGRDLDSRIDVIETYSNEVSDQIENLENKIARLQTIVYACTATAIIAIVGVFLLIKKMN